MNNFYKNNYDKLVIFSNLLFLIKKFKDKLYYKEYKNRILKYMSTSENSYPAPRRSNRRTRLIDSYLENVSNTNTQINSILSLMKSNEEILEKLLEEEIFNRTTNESSMPPAPPPSLDNRFRQIHQTREQQLNRTIDNILLSNLLNQINSAQTSQHVNNNHSSNGYSEILHNLNHLSSLFNHAHTSFSDIHRNNYLRPQESRNPFISPSPIRIRQFRPYQFFNQYESDFLNPVIVRPSREQITLATESGSYQDIENPINTSCPITLRSFQSNDIVYRIKYCGHLFSKNELDNWFLENTKCPVCRYDIREYGRSRTQNESSPSPVQNEADQSQSQDNYPFPNHLYENIFNIIDSEQENENDSNQDES